MWESIARLVLRYRLFWLILLLSVTAFMGYHASKVQLSYDFTRTIPTDNPKYKEYQEFRQRFGDDGNLLVVAVQTDKLFQPDVFSDYVAMTRRLKTIPGVDNILGFSTAVNVIRDTVTQKFRTVQIFLPPYTQARIDSGKSELLGLPFYQGLLYNAKTNAWLTGVRVNKDVMNSKRRIETVGAITRNLDSFGLRHDIAMHYSGLPLIRTRMAVKVAHETTWFLLGSVLILSIILFLFFRSISTVLLSLAVVVIGVVFSLGTMDLFGYKITLLNALTPTLVVVIGIPNCIYFMNKYHTAFRDTGDKHDALILMIGRMGVVTLFCNLTAAIGFGVFALTRSAILNEFGVVAGINIMLLFFISIILLPVVLSYLPAPVPRHMRYLENRWLAAILRRLEAWTIHHRRPVYILTALVLVISIAGMFRLQSEGFILDDLPKNDPLYIDLKFMEHNFKGVMPLEIVIDTKRRKGWRAGTVRLLDSMDQFSAYIAARPEMARPLSLEEGLKFLRQAYYGGDSAAYSVPNSYDFAFLSQYLGGGDSATKGSATKPRQRNELTQLLYSFVDTSQQRLRISINMADIGSKQLPVVLQQLQDKARTLFDSTKYKVEFTGTSVTYLEGSAFVIKGLKDSIQWSFLLIAACMLALFRSVRILLCSLIPNVIPLIVTAGIMGWAGVRLKPSTVIVFSIALGIAIDITIRFLVNYKQEQPGGNASQAVVDTINKTGISIIYTSLVLIAGFVIFCFSDFGGILALGWLTSVTLVVATLTNLIFLPVLLLTLTRSRKAQP